MLPLQLEQFQISAFIIALYLQWMPLLTCSHIVTSNQSFMWQNEQAKNASPFIAKPLGASPINGNHIHLTWNLIYSLSISNHEVAEIENKQEVLNFKCERVELKQPQLW